MQLPATPEPIRAAEYLRESTEHQKYSIENQADALRVYAASRGIQIVRTYADKKSGLHFDRRHGLRQLIEDVLTGRADFKAILVYDVTRWGRFLDPDEGAYYEYICKRANIKVHYCAEQFENLGNEASSIVAILKNVKRIMAGDFIRDLSVKVFAGQVRLFKLGFRLGGRGPGFGLRRQLIDQNGIAKCVLGAGERKSIQTDRVVLVPGSPEEIKTVRWIFSTFVERKKTELQIARILNARGVSCGLGHPWTDARVRRLLRNENFIGIVVWNRKSAKLRERAVRNPPELWLRSKCGFKPLVGFALFERAQAIIRERQLPLTDEQKLEPIKRLLQTHGFLNPRLINDAPSVPSVPTYAKWFGGLREVYRRVGYEEKKRARSSEELLANLRGLFKKNRKVTDAIIDKAPGIPCAATYRRRFGSLSQAYRLAGFAPRPDSQLAKTETTRAQSNEQLLMFLRELLRDRGRLSAKIIAETKGIPCPNTYYDRFGGLARAYELIGYSKQPSSRPNHH